MCYSGEVWSGRLGTPKLTTNSDVVRWRFLFTIAASNFTNRGQINERYRDNNHRNDRLRRLCKCSVRIGACLMEKNAIAQWAKLLFFEEAVNLWKCECNPLSHAPAIITTYAAGLCCKKGGGGRLLVHTQRPCCLSKKRVTKALTPVFIYAV